MVFLLGCDDSDSSFSSLFSSDLNSIREGENTFSRGLIINVCAENSHERNKSPPIGVINCAMAKCFHDSGRGHLFALLSDWRALFIADETREIDFGGSNNFPLATSSSIELHKTIT
jgi:hypothetical protein